MGKATIERIREKGGTSSKLFLEDRRKNVKFRDWETMMG